VNKDINNKETEIIRKSDGKIDTAELSAVTSNPFGKTLLASNNQVVSTSTSTVFNQNVPNNHPHDSTKVESKNPFNKQSISINPAFPSNSVNTPLPMNSTNVFQANSNPSQNTMNQPQHFNVNNQMGSLQQTNMSSINPMYNNMQVNQAVNEG